MTENVKGPDEMYCPSCGAIIKKEAEICPKCGVRLKKNETDSNPNAKQKVVYILLAIFLGYLGIHNFYAGYNGRGISQLLISLLSIGILIPVVWIWAIIEIITVNFDASGNKFI